ncbi:hypothetical protein ACJX0J_028569 [Zea mays]
MVAWSVVLKVFESNLIAQIIFWLLSKPVLNKVFKITNILFFGVCHTFSFIFRVGMGSWNTCVLLDQFGVALRNSLVFNSSSFFAWTFFVFNSLQFDTLETLSSCRSLYIYDHGGVSTDKWYLKSIF